MWTHVRSLLTPPVFSGDEDRTRAALTLHTLLLSYCAVVGLAGVAAFVIFTSKVAGFSLAATFLLPIFGAFRLMRRGHVRAASLITVIGSWLIITAYLLLSGGMTSVAMVFYLACATFAGLLLGNRAALATAVASSLAGLVMILLWNTGHAIPRLFLMPPQSGWMDMTFSLYLITVTLTVALKNLREALSNAQQQLVRRQQAEEALSESERKFHDIARNIPGMAFQYRAPAAGGSGRFSYASPRGLELFGLPLDLSGQDLRSLGQHLPPEDRGTFAAAFEQALAQRANWHCEGRLSLPGSDKWFECLASPTLEGEEVVFDGLFLDVTERRQARDVIEAQYEQLQAQNQELLSQDTLLRRAEADLRRLNTDLEQRVTQRTAELSQANAALARAARLKDEFLAGMSHELRTPLNAILGLSEALQISEAEPPTPGQQQALHGIHESGEHLLALITDILDLSKIEAGKLELNLSPFLVDDLCEASLQMVRQAAHQKGLKLTYHRDPIVTRLSADERRLKQILVNLLSNAVKFTPTGGALGLEVRGDQSRLEVHFMVWDNGVGIAPEYHDQLFQPFVQLNNRAGGQQIGTGLGLALVARMAALHGGRVELESEGLPGKGSRFTVILPWRSPKTTALLARPTPETPRTATDWAGVEAPLILVVDDSDINLNTLQRLLTSAGYQVALARNGREALAVTRARRPAVILMDIQMPEMDGFATTRALRTEADLGLAAIPVIALTGLAMPGDRERCLDAGANAYLAKPVTLTQLRQAIKTLLGGSA
jgi:PAS domain S-box-containing protein